MLDGNGHPVPQDSDFNGVKLPVRAYKVFGSIDRVSGAATVTQVKVTSEDDPDFRDTTGTKYELLCKPTQAGSAEATSVGVARAGPVEDATAAYRRGDYATAMRLFRQFAEQGNAVAQYNLGIIYAYGRGIPQDFREAAKWYRLGAEQGIARAQYNLAVMYDRGLGLVQDYREALKWYRLAAEQNNSMAQSNLGLMYFQGHGVTQDYREAAKWFRLAAKQGNAEAQNNLGGMYAQGQGVTQDYLRAHMWLNLAASRLSSDAGKAAIQNRDIIAESLSPSQVVRAQEMARKCEANNLKNCD
jgi:TPR repeat protein